MQNRPLIAAAHIMTAMAIIGLIDQFIRVIAIDSSLWTFHLLRSVMIWAIALTWLAISRKRLEVVSWRGVLARSAFNATGLLIYFGALGFLPVAQAAAGLFSAPIFVLILSVALFRLRIGPVRIVAAFTGFAGVLMVLAPDVSTLSPAAFVPLAAGLFYAMAAIATREWCPDEHALTLTLGGFAFMGLWGLLGIVSIAVAGGEGADFLTRGWVWPTPEVLWWCIVQALGSLIAVVLLTRGYQLAEASLVSVFEYSVLGFSALFGLLVWGDVLSVPAMLGLLFIAAAGSLIALRGRGVPA